MLNAFPPIDRHQLFRLFVFTLGAALLLFAGVARAQYPILDRIAQKVIQKYQQSSCEQLYQKRGQPQSEREQRAIQFMRNNPDMRTCFINQVAGPIANKMFECGLIP
jgi:hypothetical protein